MSAVALQSAARAHEVGVHAAMDLEKLPVEKVLAQLAVKPEQGLSSAEARQRLAKYGPNALVEKEVSLSQDRGALHRAERLHDRGRRDRFGDHRALGRFRHHRGAVVLQCRARILAGPQGPRAARLGWSTTAISSAAGI